MTKSRTNRSKWMGPGLTSANGKINAANVRDLQQQMGGTMGLTLPRSYEWLITFSQIM